MDLRTGPSLCLQWWCVREKSLCESLRVPATMHLSTLASMPDLLLFLLGELNVKGSKIFIKALDLRGTRLEETLAECKHCRAHNTYDWYDVWTLCHQPRQSELRSSDVLLLGNCVDLIDKCLHGA